MDRLKSAVDKILGRLPNARGRGEEATKQSLVLPLLDALGYDIWNPAEVCPEYEADFAIRKYGQKEKVDLAVFLQDVPRIYFEVKSVDAALDGHEGQLSRYFNATTSVSLAVLNSAGLHLATASLPRPANAASAPSENYQEKHTWAGSAAGLTPALNPSLFPCFMENRVHASHEPCHSRN